MKQNIENCLIVIDSGFSPESLRSATVVATRDCRNGNTNIGEPFVTSEQLQAFAGDPLNHGSIVLEKLLALSPETPVILIRAIAENNTVIRTRWHDGQVVQEGWTEAYIWAVELCRRLGATSVANCSFGGIVHAADGTGWESHQLAQVTGTGKAGHVLVAASGAGDGRAVHASWFTQPGATTVLQVRQTGSTNYNFWAGAAHQEWWLVVRLNSKVVGEYQGAGLDSNMWNDRQQLTFFVDGSGDVTFEFALGSAEAPLRCDCFCNDNGRFANYVDPRLVSEPACFPHVIATGLRFSSYGQGHSDSNKPEMLVDGEGPISFRTPEVTMAAARILLANPTFDVDQVRAALRQ